MVEDVFVTAPRSPRLHGHLAVIVLATLVLLGMPTCRGHAHDGGAVSSFTAAADQTVLRHDVADGPVGRGGSVCEPAKLVLPAVQPESIYGPEPAASVILDTPQTSSHISAHSMEKTNTENVAFGARLLLMVCVSQR
jgi:hypothetical protein